MPSTLNTPLSHGYFDFLSQIIIFPSFIEKHKDELLAAMRWTPDIGIPSFQLIEHRGLLKHEFTHFLDMTTTAWGLEYTYRKQRLAERLVKNEGYVQELEVFMLNSAEIEVHAKLLNASKTPPLECDLLQHTLIYHEQFGVVLMILLLKDHKVQHRIPLSMLSLLEANATASEYLSMFLDAETLQDVVRKKLDNEEIQRKYEVMLNNPEGLEYSVLLHLARLHLSMLSLNEQLSMVAALARFALNASDIAMSKMANSIRPSILNPEFGNGICNELRRGAQRPLLFFKILLYIYGWMENVSLHERDMYIQLMKSDPHSAVKFILTTEYKVEGAADGLEIVIAEFRAKIVSKMSLLADKYILESSFGANAPQLDHASAGTLPFEKLHLPNVVLKDGTEIEPPNRIDLGLNDYQDNHMTTLVSLDKVYRENQHKRFHLPPNQLLAPG